MYNIIFSLDYEIHGNGEGSPLELLVKPTRRLLKLFNNFGAKLTIMADVAEILKYKEYYEIHNHDKFYYQEVMAQLHLAIDSGHDVQLHIHSGYFNSEYDGNKWLQNWDEYDLANLDLLLINQRIKTCKEFLENELNKTKADYKCIAFRAANWSMMPTKKISTSLIQNGIKIDSSVFKWGKRSGRVKFDYTDAYDQLLPWFVNVDNINDVDNEGKLLEIPIYAALQRPIKFLTLLRIYRILNSLTHRHEKTTVKMKPAQERSNLMKKYIVKLYRFFTKKTSWKLDFNQATGRQLISALKKIENNYEKYNIDIPIVLIGHSKSFTNFNEKQLIPLLNYLNKNESKYHYSLFKDIDIELYRNLEK
jgi:hypothetical protein